MAKRKMPSESGEVGAGLAQRFGGDKGTNLLGTVTTTKDVSGITVPVSIRNPIGGK